MNFLAHTYLSGTNDEIIVGNFMGDYIKGKNYVHLPELIKKGILIHRDIDYFTDTHPITRESRLRLSEKYHKYAGIIVDILYDHFLASNWKKYCAVSLEDYVNNAYLILKKHYEILPIGIKVWFPTFLENNWLLTYQTIDGIERVLDRMSENTSLPDYTSYAITVLRNEYASFASEFETFFIEIIAFIEEKYQVSISSQSQP